MSENNSGATPPFLFGDRVVQTTQTTGTGDITLLAGPVGTVRFKDEFSFNTKFYYWLEDESKELWEHGVGFLANSNRMVRDTVLKTSAGNTNPITLPSGTSLIWSAAGADEIVMFDSEGGIDGRVLSKDGEKLDLLTVTDPINLDDIAERVESINGSVVIMRGYWDASSGSYPSDAQGGYSYIVSVAGTVDGVEYVENERIIAIDENDNLSFGKYLKGGAQAYALTDIELNYLDQLEFYYVHFKYGINQTILSTDIAAIAIEATTSNLLNYDNSLIDLTVNGARASSGSFTFEDGRTYIIRCTTKTPQKITCLLAAADGTNRTEGVVAKLTVTQADQLPDGEYVKPNGSNRVTVNETVLSGPSEIELTWERRDQELDGTGVTWLLGNTENDSTQDRIVAFDSNHPTAANRLVIFTENGEVNLDSIFFDGVAQGQFVTIKITLNDNQIDFYLDGELKGTRFDDDARIVPFSITELGAAKGGSNASRGIISDVKITDHSKLPKGTYLGDQAGTYTDVSIPAVVGDVLTFDYLYRDNDARQVILGTVNRTSPLRVEPDGTLSFSGTYNSEVKVNGNVVASDVFQMVEGETYAIQTTIDEIDTITKIGASNSGGLRNEGVIANFNLNDGEYLYEFNNVIDNGDNTGIAPQTGTTAEYGSNLLVGDNTSFESSIGSWYAISSSEIDLSWDTSGAMLMTRLTSGWASVYTGDAVLEEGKLYSIDIDVDFSGGSGFQNLYVSFGGNELGKIPTTHVGTLTFTGVSSADAAFRLYHKDNSTTQYGLIKSVVIRELSNGFIPSFDPLIDQYTAEPNVIYWPMNEVDGLNVPAYDDPERDLWKEEELILGTNTAIISEGVYGFDDAVQYQSIRNNIGPLPDGFKAKVTFEVFDCVQGSIQVQINGDSNNASTPAVNANGIYTFDVAGSGSTGNPNRVVLRAADVDGLTTAKVRNVSIILDRTPWTRDLWREQGLQYGTGTSRLGMNDYEFDDSPQFQGIFNEIESLPDGTQVDVTFEIYDYVQGSIDVVIRSDSEQALSPNRSANGIYSESLSVVGAASGSFLRVLVRSDNPINATCKVRNVSMIVKKDGTWSAGTDVSDTLVQPSNENYEYKLSNIIDQEDGTAIAPATGTKGADSAVLFYDQQVNEYDSNGNWWRYTFDLSAYAKKDDLFPAGTRMMFVQAVAPTGWRKDISAGLDQAALKIVTGSGGGTSGTRAFDNIFTTQAVTGSVINQTAGGSISSTTAGGSVANHTLVTSQIPSHNHQEFWIYLPTSSPMFKRGEDWEQYSEEDPVFGYTGGGGAHKHGFTGSAHGHTFSGLAHGHGFTGNAIDLSVKQVSAIVCEKQ